MQTMYLLSGGAATGLVRATQSAFEIDSGMAMECTFSAVGAIEKRLLDGAPCDVLILTRALIESLITRNVVTNGTAQDLGIVKTGVAVKSGELHPHVHDAESLRSALCAASAIFLPDPQMSTAGIHVMKVLRALGLADTLSDRLRPYANGNTAMNAMAVCAEMDVVGLTQVTEILITPGVDLVANLPKEFELATVYTAAIARRAASPLAAEDYIAVLAGNAQAALRSKAGFLPST